MSMKSKRHDPAEDWELKPGQALKPIRPPVMFVGMEEGEDIREYLKKNYQPTPEEIAADENDELDHFAKQVEEITGVSMEDVFPDDAKQHFIAAYLKDTESLRRERDEILAIEDPELMQQRLAAFAARLRKLQDGLATDSEAGHALADLLAESVVAGAQGTTP